MAQSEPPSTRSPSLSRLFRVGRNSRGNWVAQDDRGLCGGLFVNRVDAMKFAKFENGNHPEAVILVPGIIELNLSDRPNQRISIMDANTEMRRAA
jgi:hypothetical protein